MARIASIIAALVAAVGFISGAVLYVQAVAASGQGIWAVITKLHVFNTLWSYDPLWLVLSSVAFLGGGFAFAVAQQAD